MKRLMLSIKSDAPPSFRSMLDAGEFLRKLHASQPSEINTLLLLQLFMPSDPSKLVGARWQDFNFELGVWTIKPSCRNPNTGRGSQLQAAVLSQSAFNILDAHRVHFGLGEFLFPSLLAMRKADRERLVSEALQSLWPQYSISIDGFRYFFSGVAQKLGYFQKRFIESVMNCKPSDTSAAYILHNHALLDWWTRELLQYAAYSHPTPQFIRQV